jgi:hypothetical protein
MNTIGGIKYKRSTIRNQSTMQKYFSSPMGPQRGKMKKNHVLKKVSFSKPVNLIMVDLVIFDTPCWVEITFSF